jgi:hypothetical protein
MRNCLSKLLNYPKLSRLLELSHYFSLKCAFNSQNINLALLRAILTNQSELPRRVINSLPSGNFLITPTPQHFPFTAQSCATKANNYRGVTEYTGFPRPDSSAAPPIAASSHSSPTMSTYESMNPHRNKTRLTKANAIPGEHNTGDPSTAPTARRRRPDLSTFFSTLSQITPAPDHRPHAVPVPGDVSAAFFSLAEALDMMRRESDSAQSDTQEGTDNASSDTGRDLLTTMIQSLLSQADTPPREVEGVNEEFCDSKKHSPSSPCPSTSPANSVYHLHN